MSWILRLMSDSYVLLWRRIVHTSFYKKPHACRLAIHLIITAAWKDHTVFLGGKPIEIYRGSLPTGRLKLSQETGLSVRQIRTSLVHLVNADFLTIKATNQGSIITLCKYNRWQDSKQHTAQRSDQRPTSDRPATDHTEEVKKGKKVKKTNLVRDLFETFWMNYPKKVGKGAARKVWIKINVDQKLLDKMLKTLTQFKNSEQWQRENGQFIPNPATWLSQERWDDVVGNLVDGEMDEATQQARAFERKYCGRRN